MREDAIYWSRNPPRGHRSILYSYVHTSHLAHEGCHHQGLTWHCIGYSDCLVRWEWGFERWFIHFLNVRSSFRRMRRYAHGGAPLILTFHTSAIRRHVSRLKSSRSSCSVHCFLILSPCSCKWALTKDWTTTLARQPSHPHSTMSH